MSQAPTPQIASRVQGTVTPPVAETSDVMMYSVPFLPALLEKNGSQTTARDSMWGPTFPELVEALPGVNIIDRFSVNAFDDARVARAIEATGRKKLIFAGISLEVCAAFPAITAVGKGLDAYVAVDASGTFSETKREAGLLRLMQAGVILSDYASLMVEILKDNARPEASAVYGAIDMPWAKLVGQIAQAYGK
jgi:nicotinamidase-related amidase